MKKPTLPNKQIAFTNVLAQAQKAADAGMAVYQAIDKILWNDWDPIGVRSICPAAHDEYEDYVPELAMLKLSNTGVKKIAEQLFRLEKSLAYKTDAERCRKVAEKINSL